MEVFLCATDGGFHRSRPGSFEGEISKSKGFKENINFGLQVEVCVEAFIEMMDRVNLSRN